MHELDHQFTIISVNELKCHIGVYVVRNIFTMQDLRLIGCLVIFLFVPNIFSSKIIGADVRNESNFIGTSCEDITRIVLKSNEKNETNFIFSPLGYSVILGILSEGARGITKSELSSVLRLPQDVNLVRQSFKAVLQRLQDKNPVNVPEFRNFFYVYKNFTIEDDYKKTLFENYFTEVKNVERPNPIDSEITTNMPLTSESTEVYTEPSLLNTTFTISSRSKRKNKQRIKRMAKRFLGIDLADTSKREVSSLSANNLNSDELTRSLSRIIIFNGLYFNGFWKTPFQYKQGEEPFYKTKLDTVMTKMVYSVGKFKIGNISELNSTVLFIPYKGERYSFVIILPNEKDGLQNLLINIDKINLREIRSNSELKNMQISIPAFEFKTVSYLKEPFSEIGIQKVFSKEADFSGISKDTGLFVDDIVQLVTIKVDDEAGTPNFLTATSLQTRTVTEKFTADHPFLFFVQDHKDELIIAAGKLYVPTMEEDLN